MCTKYTIPYGEVKNEIVLTTRSECVIVRQQAGKWRTHNVISQETVHGMALAFIREGCDVCCIPNPRHQNDPEGLSIYLSVSGRGMDHLIYLGLSSKRRDEYIEKYQQAIDRAKEDAHGDQMCFDEEIDMVFRGDKDLQQVYNFIEFLV